MQEVTVPQFTEEVQAGDLILVFVLWTGAYYSPEGWQPVFLINEFSSKETDTFWKAELATCVPGA